MSTLDFSMGKIFGLSKLREGMRLLFRMDASNILNHPASRPEHESARRGWESYPLPLSAAAWYNSALGFPSDVSAWP